jgi:hypothetical protein
MASMMENSMMVRKKVSSKMASKRESSMMVRMMARMSLDTMSFLLKVSTIHMMVRRK